MLEEYLKLRNDWGGPVSYTHAYTHIQCMSTQAHARHPCMCGTYIHTHPHTVGRRAQSMVSWSYFSYVDSQSNLTMLSVPSSVEIVYLESFHQTSEQFPALNNGEKDCASRKSTEKKCTKAWTTRMLQPFSSLWSSDLGPTLHRLSPFNGNKAPSQHYQRKGQISLLSILPTLRSKAFSWLHCSFV